MVAILLFMKREKYKAFTLIEIMIAISLMGVISYGIITFFDSAINSWLYTSTQYELQEASATCIENIIEGAYKYDSLREVLEVVKGSDTSITFIPWWKQKITHIIPEKKIPLDFELSPVSPFPVAQVWDVKKGSYVFCNVNYYPASLAGGRIKSLFAFQKDAPPYSKGRIFFHPMVSNNKKVEMTIFFDKDKHMIYRRYRGKSIPLIKMTSEVIVSDFHIEYLNEANSLIVNPGSSEQNKGLSMVTALRLIVTVKKDNLEYTLRSFVNIRKKRSASAGLILIEGSKIKIPNSKKIKTLSIINFLGVKKNSSIYLVINSLKENKSYGVNVRLTLKNDIPWIEGYDIEYPKRKKVFSNNSDVPVSHGINLLIVDYVGVYDYDYDEGIEGQVNFSSDDVEVILEKSTINGISLLVR